MEFYTINEIEYLHHLTFNFWFMGEDNTYYVSFDYATEKKLIKSTKKKAIKIIQDNYKKFNRFFIDKDFENVKKQWVNLYELIGEELLKARIKVRLYNHFRLRTHHKGEIKDSTQSIYYKVFVNNA